jgi:hypothetical protein
VTCRATHLRTSEAKKRGTDYVLRWCAVTVSEEKTTLYAEESNYTLMWKIV